MADSFIDIIDTFLITLEKERNFSLHTIKAYKNDLIRFKLFLIQDKSRIVFKEINRNDIRKFLADEYDIIADLNEDGNVNILDIVNLVNLIL